MVTIAICVGSSCHLKGAYDIIHQCEETISKLGLRDQVELKGTFCLGKCSQEGVTIVIDDEIETGVTPDNFQRIFEEKILVKVRED
ncbi:MAG TPA: (2Fe-2S) ferredoxin domain-containing protein [Atribacter sp.]|jgi:NADH:ubiquinone oxidoreductase subunit E|uniref:Respiratory-chain NADH dehydrogenase 24 Kd subunit n=1 Tax=Candidatus Atribacter allofermentans TaxID=1852833 RepID=A0A1V5T2N1_9BACT|nr:(2Fe-2S) ferredoxin domain-containing protein [Atribacter sp.]MDD3713672.1 (2Fe-2S) ferredoxin domain-containing protein [Atribacterota bacterium]OQA60874.1 MAG: Respiratory-chain NADH dehydrogenase 24 Kd subunit [Candidatus Atribacteria bacterium ADurb.Bin276]HHT09419.1 (2Fe-2S) ferredoxin domain-containing protein [Candidatus Atribacteria bacterium]MDI9595844.1 (2Fe-2S) ferredoxin domain-containing protein [Atribacterota bacterium]HQK84288.1 (2Fe-2S) ferredoxin domain-containing protein [